MSKKNIRKIALCFTLWVGSISVYAQVSQGGFPFPEQLTVNNLRSISSAASSQVPFVEMPAFDRDKILREDSLADNRAGGFRFARKFNVSITPDDAGISTFLADGTKVWRVGIRSREAFSLNILFTEFSLPPGAKVFVYSPDRNTILGAFTEKNNQPGGILPVAPIDGDEIIVEYSEPANVPFKGKISIGEVNHDYRGLHAALRLLPGSGKQLQPCEVNATCSDVHPEQRRSTCLIIVDGNMYCSGNLVNNTAQDGTPYVLSAAHCLYDNRQNIVPSKAERSVFFFNYETPDCFPGIQGTMEMSVAGSTVQAALKQRDMLLFRLNEEPPVDYRVYYAGWNISQTASAPAYLFHHPQGNLKKRSVDEHPPIPVSSTFDNLFLPNGHWQISHWEEGVTEAGSSGSGLFDAQNRLIGNLSGGSSVCTAPYNDFFYRLNVAWNSSNNANENLEPWLDPANTHTLFLDGKEQDENPCIRLTNRMEGEQLTATNSPDGYAAGHNKRGITEYAERFSSRESSRLYGIYFLPQKGLYSASAPVYAEVYSGNTAPENLLHRQEVKMTNTAYEPGTGFTEKNLAYFRQKENYLRFTGTINVDTSFFVVFKLPEMPADTFALYYTTGRSTDGLNTAWFKDGAQWKPFTENPLATRPASLMVDAVVRPSDANSTGQFDTISKKTEIFPNPTQNELTVRFPEGNYPVQLRLSDLSGRILFIEDNLHGRFPYTLFTNSFCENGIFFLHIVYPDRTEALKFVKLNK
ncbi:MAG: T9SS type A sorting domain-containing protein [Prevotellaceae bacterium]|jgi:hypothetical protein|nr:T9SS type A sorting domain-containing protein [Prevotellaceae bacterium]